MASQKTTRRQFHKAVATAAFVGPLAAFESAAAGDAPAPRAADALMDLVRARYGKHLNEDRLKRVRGRVEGALAGAERLREVALRNADEPDFVFFAEGP